jgi:hypothetical protein
MYVIVVVGHNNSFEVILTVQHLSQFLSERHVGIRIEEALRKHQEVDAITTSESE